MDRKTERQAGVAAETASLPPSPRTLQACAAQQVGTDRWHGLGALMDARCYGQVVGSSSLGAMRASSKPLASDVQNPGGGWHICQLRALKNFNYGPEKSCLQQPTLPASPQCFLQVLELQWHIGPSPRETHSTYPACPCTSSSFHLQSLSQPPWRSYLK